MPAVERRRAFLGWVGIGIPRPFTAAGGDNTVPLVVGKWFGAPIAALRRGEVTT
jgi:hypothetical protein